MQPRSLLAYAYALAVLQDTPLAYYRLNEASGLVAVDSTVYKNNGAYNNSAGSVSYGQLSIFAVDGSTAITINNDAGYITVPLLSAQLANVSLECVLKLPNALQQGYAMKVGDTGTGYGLGIGGGNVRTPGLMLCGELDNIADVPSGFNLTATRWQHCAMTLSSTQALFYVAGSLVGTTTAGTALTPTGHAYIATCTKTTTPHISLSDCAFYNYILSPTQIANHALLAV